MGDNHFVSFHNDSGGLNQEVVDKCLRIGEKRTILFTNDEYEMRKAGLWDVRYCF